MQELIKALFSADLPFLRYAFGIGILASVAFGIIGTYVVARRITYIAGAVSHCVLAGIGLGLFVQYRNPDSWLDPTMGAIIAALTAALLIGLVSLYARQREDSVIGALWAIGMALGLLFIARTPGYVDPMSYLFGNILLLNKGDLWIVAGLDIVVVGLGSFFFHKFQAVCFDEEFVRIRGVHAEVYYLLLLCLTALTIVLLVRVVGIVMVVALLTLPAAVAGILSNTLRQMMLYAVLFCMFFIVSGLSCSYIYDLPSGPAIIVFAGSVYLTIVLWNRFVRHGK